MIKVLSNLRWKEFIRVGYMGSGAINSAGGIIFFLSIAINYVILAYFLDFILIKTNPDYAPVVLVNKYLIYFFIIDFVARFFTQSLQKVNIRSLILLPLSKTNLSRYIISSGLLELGNLSILFFLVVFGMRSVAQDFGALKATAWGASIFLFSTCVIMGILVLKRKFGNKPIVGLLPIIIAALVIFSEFYFDLNILKAFSMYLFGLSLFSPIGVLIFVGLALIVFSISVRFYVNLMHLENEKVSYSRFDQIEISYLDNFGISMKMVQQELRLIFRNKRPRTVLVMSVIFLLYGLIFFLNPVYENMSGMTLFVAVFSTGMFVTNYGQLMLGWESENFDFYLANNISFEQFYQAKYNLLASSVIIATFFFSFYGFIDLKFIGFGIIGGLYNLGIAIPIMLWFSVYNRKKIDLSKGASMNYEGFSASHYLLIIPVFALPMLIYLVGKLFLGVTTALLITAGISLLGIIFKNFFIKMAANRLRARKYVISSAFRQIS
jgi:hypothetical protein